MDPSRFDTLVRALAGNASRRRLLGLLSSLPVGAAIAGLPGDEALAERPHERLRRRSKQRNRKQRNRRRRNAQSQPNNGNGGGLGGPERCTANGGACQQDSECCSDNCFGQVCSAPVTQCGSVTCPAGSSGCCAGNCCTAGANQCNAVGECCAPNCDGRQCGPDGCGNAGTCGTCSGGAPCNETTGQCGPPPICTAQSCPDGCCSNGPGNPGTCETGESFGQCGSGGVRCARCSDSQTCQNKQCTTCTDSCTCSGQSACLEPHAANAYCSSDDSCYCAVTRAGVAVCASGAIEVSGGCQTDQDCVDAVAGSYCIGAANNDDPENPCIFVQSFCAGTCNPQRA